MGVVFQSLDVAHSRLITSRIDFRESDDLDDNGFLYEEFSFSLVALPRPLEDAVLSFYHPDEDHYASSFRIDAKKFAAFRGLSRKLQGRFGESWLPTDKDGSGYLLDRTSKKLGVSLISYVDDCCLYITIGSAGAELRELGDLEQFANELKNLERVSNVVIEECSNSRKNREFTQVLKYKINVTP